MRAAARGKYTVMSTEAYAIGLNRELFNARQPLERLPREMWEQGMRTRRKARESDIRL